MSAPQLSAPGAAVLAAEGLASGALGAAERGNITGASAVVDAIAGRGFPAIRRALEWWADAVLYDQHGLVGPDVAVHLVLVSPTGHPAEQPLTSAEQWATQWIAARAGLDQAACAQLLAEVSAMPTEVAADLLLVTVTVAAMSLWDHAAAA